VVVVVVVNVMVFRTGVVEEVGLRLSPLEGTEWNLITSDLNYFGYVRREP